MTENKNLTLLKIALGIFALVTIVYGITLVFFAENFIAMSGAEPFDPNWLRWPGATLLGLGLGAILALRNPGNQEGFVIALALATLFVGLVLLWELIFQWQPQYSVSFTLAPCLINLCMSILFWWGRAKAK